MDCIIIFLSENIFKILLVSFVVHDSFCSATDIFCIIFEKIYLLLEFLGMPDVIMVLDSDIVSLSLGEEEIESIIWSEIFLASQ